VVAASALDVAPVLAKTSLAACLEDRALGWSLPGTGKSRRLQAHFVFATSERRAQSFFVPAAPPRVVLRWSPKLDQPAGGLDKDVIYRVIQAKQDQIKFCYERELRDSPKLEGMVRVQWTIGPDGSVIQSDIIDDTLERKRAADCIINVVEHLKFPAPMGGGNVNVTFPWIFKSAGDGAEEE
jgi:hypothetical protein